MEVVTPVARLDKTKLLAEYICIEANNLLVLRENTMYYYTLYIIIGRILSLYILYTLRG